VLRQSERPDPRGKGKGAEPAGARGRGQQRAKGGDNNLPSLLALSRVKTDQFTFAYLQRYKYDPIIRENKNTNSCSQIDYGTTQTRLDLKEWLFRPLLLPLLLLLLLLLLPGKRIRVPEPTSQTLLNGLPVALVEDASHRNTCREARICRIVSASVLKQYKRTGRD
jgi:hypothetical protein